MKKCCVTGHRPKGFAWDYNQKESPSHKLYRITLKNAVERLISLNFDYFISGGAIGVDLDFAETVLELKNENPNIQLEIAVPCPNQTLKWSQNEKERYNYILSHADVVTLVSSHYTRFCMLKRNEYMVNNSDHVIAVWNGQEQGGTWYTICYARKQRKDITYIRLDKVS